MYGRVSKDKEQLFLKTATGIVGTVKEPSNWMKPRNIRKHAGGIPLSYIISNPLNKGWNRRNADIFININLRTLQDESLRNSVYDQIIIMEAI